MYDFDSSPPSCFLAPCAEGRRCEGKGGHAVFAVRDIAPGELIAVWGGTVTSGSWLAERPELRRLALQLDEDLYVLSSVEGPADWINHSCDPNAGIRGQVSLVALRWIGRGEEICFDYAMTDSSPYDEFRCHCGAPACRGWVRGNDWKRPELVLRYRGFFSSYLQARIDGLRSVMTATGRPTGVRRPIR